MINQQILFRKIFDLQLKSNTKLVLLALQYYCHDKHYCFPSQQSLAERTGLSKSSVERALNDLITLKLISKKTRGFNSSKQYTLNLKLILIKKEKEGIRHTDETDTSHRRTNIRITNITGNTIEPVNNIEGSGVIRDNKSANVKQSQREALKALAAPNDALEKEQEQKPEKQYTEDELMALRMALEQKIKNIEKQIKSN
jgi:DNA-binding transcriptional MocR family regulator